MTNPHAEGRAILASGDNKCEPERAIERLGNMLSLYAEVVIRFLDDTSGNFAKLRHAVAAGDIQRTQQTAHSLKGLAAMCGASGVTDILDEIETAGREADAERIATCAERLELAMRATRETLAPYRLAE